MISIEFLLTSAVVVITPGAGVLFTISTGLGRGRLASLYAALGCTLGILPHMAAATLGLMGALHAGAQFFELLRLAGVCYLFYLAIITWRDRTMFADATPSDVHARPLATVLKAVLLNLLNPKLTLFFMAFLPQFIDPTAASPLFSFGVLSAVFMLMTLGVFALYGVLAHTFRQAVMASPAIQTALKRTFAAAFALMAARLAVSDH